MMGYENLLPFQMIKFVLKYLCRKSILYRMLGKLYYMRHHNCAYYSTIE